MRPSTLAAEDIADILDTHQKLSGDELFESLCYDLITVEEVELILGNNVAADYARWIYLNIK